MDLVDRDAPAVAPSAARPEALEPCPALPPDLLGQIALLERLAVLITSHDPDDGAASLAAEASRRTVAVIDRLVAQRLAWLGRVEGDGLWRADTVRSFPYWVAWQEKRSLAAARREALAASRLRDHLPATLRSARAGRLTAPQVEVLSRTLPTSDARCAELARAHLQTGPAEGDGPGGRGVDGDDVPSWSDPRHAPGCTADRGACTCDRASITGEQAMLGVAARFDLRDLGKAARRFAHIADPESDDRGYSRAQDREHLDLSLTLGGYHLSGFLTEENGQVLRTALDAATGVPSKDDGLRPTQRRAIALAGVARSFLERGETGGAGAGVRPHLTVLVPWRDFVELAGNDPRAEGAGRGDDAGRSDDAGRGDGAWRGDGAGRGVGAGRGEGAGRGDLAGQGDAADRGDPPRRAARPGRRALPGPADELAAELLSPGPTWLDGSGPVPRQILERIAADCAVTRVVFGPDSEVLDVGRSQRTFTSARRKAVIARDQGCVWPGCKAPVQISEIHHARVHWADGGTTSTDNAALLCWFHHRHVDRERIAMAWRGRWAFSQPGGYDWLGDPPADPLPVVRTRGRAETKDGTGARAETDARLRSGSGLGSGTGSQPGSGVQAGAGLQPGSGVQAGAGLQPGSGVQAGAGLQPGSRVQARANAREGSSDEPGG